MAAARQPVAHHVLFALLGAALIALGVRLFIFQQTCQAEMMRRATGQQRIRIPIPARRGDIYANSHAMPLLLAASRQVPSCFADPTMIKPEELPSVCEAVGAALGRPAAEVRAAVARGGDSRFVWLAREMDEKTADRVRKLRLPGVGVIQEWRRYYPNGTLAAHVVGLVGMDDAGRPDGVGLEGMELYADKYLRAVDGVNVVLGDAARRPIWNAPGEYTPPQDGRHVQLTIDAVIHICLEQALAQTVEKYDAEAAMGVVVDPRTGAILAMANVPTYDPNARGEAPQDQRRNRAITDPYEPGSIFKPYTASMALAMGKVTLDKEFFCHNGAYQCRPGRTLHDAGHGYGTLTFSQIVFKSSNIGMAQVGEIMGNRNLFDTIRAFGFGQKTGIDLPGEDAGIVRPFNLWSIDSKWSIPMGQEVGITCLQMAMGFAAIANDGLLLKPKLIRAVYDSGGEVVVDNSAPQPVRQVIDKQVARTFVREVLARVPSKEGTGKLGILNGWTSFGKTGTAQIPPYSAGKYTSSYIAGAPLENPRLVCLISVRKPDRSKGYYGGTVAAPAVKAVLEKSLAYLEAPKDAESPSAGGARESPAGERSREIGW